MKDGAMVIKWHADGSYDTLRPGTNRMVCYDQSGEPSEQPFSSQCTSVGNLDRVKQNKEYEAKEAARTKREAMLAKSPPAQPFRLRAEMVKQGRTNQIVAKTDNMVVNLKVYAGGGENGLHNHTDEDHFHLILQGSARFHGPRNHFVFHKGMGHLPTDVAPDVRGRSYRIEAEARNPASALLLGWTATGTTAGLVWFQLMAAVSVVCRLKWQCRHHLPRRTAAPGADRSRDPD